MSASQAKLRHTIRVAEETAQRPMIIALAHAIGCGRSNLELSHMWPNPCGRAWSLAQCRKSTRKIEQMLAENNGGSVL